ncbi:cytochrome P450 monooxygenase [Desarmillaria ectypa]|nr:cytochrome P450 monooxygenase [Desarmillaria ectypa]
MSYQDHHLKVIHDLHRIYDPFICLVPNHISIALPDSQLLVYRHRNRALKSSFYDVFITTSSSLFTICDCQSHTHKWKIISHSFSQKSILKLQPYVHYYVSQLLGQWKQLYDKALKGMSGKKDEDWIGHDGRLWLDCFPCNDLAFGTLFRIVIAAKGFTLIAEDQHAVMDSYGQAEVRYALKEIEVIKTLGGPSQTFLAMMGALPKSGQDFCAIIGLAVMAVLKRLEVPMDRNDLLSKLQAGKDEDMSTFLPITSADNPMGKEELTAEVLTLLITGSDTTTNSSCIIIYYLALTLNIQEKLQKELDKHLDSDITTAEQVKNLPYLQAIINKRLNHFSEGTVISAPTYTIYQDPTVFGDDAEKFSSSMSMAFTPFFIIIVSILKCFHFVLKNPDKEVVHEGILRKLVVCHISMQRHEVP